MSKPEKIAERKFSKLVERKYKGLAIKQTTAGPYGARGYNDRICFLPGKIVHIVEFKREGEKPTKIQRYRHRQFRRMGFKTHVAHSCPQAERQLQESIEAKKVSARKHKVRS